MIKTMRQLRKERPSTTWCPINRDFCVDFCNPITFATNRKKTELHIIYLSNDVLVTDKENVTEEEVKVYKDSIDNDTSS